MLIKPTNISDENQKENYTELTQKEMNITFETNSNFELLNEQLNLPIQNPKINKLYPQKRDYKVKLDVKDKCGPSHRAGEKFDVKRDVFLLLVVKSICKFRSRRAAIRATWGNESWARQFLHFNVRLVFLLGNCQEGNESSLESESREHNDILQWDFADNFRMVTLKDVLFLRWVARNCREVPFIYKGDDDVFVNTPNLIKHLVTSVRREELTSLMLGWVMRKSRRVDDASDKYYVSPDLYPRDFYPPYVSGGAFVMTGKLALRLFEAALTTPMFPIDDAFVGVLLRKVGVSPKSDPRFKLYPWQVCDFSVDFACHRVKLDYGNRKLLRMLLEKTVIAKVPLGIAANDF